MLNHGDIRKRAGETNNTEVSARRWRLRYGPVGVDRKDCEEAGFLRKEIIMQ